MRYTEARELIEAALDILNEEIMSNKMYNSPSPNKNKYPMKKTGSTPVAKPTGGTTPSISPAVRMGARNTGARWRRGNRWVLKQIKAKAAKAGNVQEMNQLDELSKKLMGRYINKASRSIADLGRGEVNHLMRSKTSSEYGKRMKETDRKIRKRTRGIDLATDAMVSEAARKIK